MEVIEDENQCGWSPQSILTFTPPAPLAVAVRDVLNEPEVTCFRGFS